MHSRIDNIKFASYNDVDEVANELFESLRSRYQEHLETSMRGSGFVSTQFNFCIINVTR